MNLIEVRDYAVDISFDAGTIGTRGYQTSTNIEVEGFTPIAISVVYIGNSTAFNVNCFFNSLTTLVYTNAYRAVATAVTSSVRFRVLYLNNSLLRNGISALSD